MTFEEVVEMLKEVYEKVKNMMHIEMLLAYSLYLVWVIAERREKKK